MFSSSVKVLIYFCFCFVSSLSELYCIIHNKLKLYRSEISENVLTIFGSPKIDLICYVCVCVCTCVNSKFVVAVIALNLNKVLFARLKCNKF